MEAKDTIMPLTEASRIMRYECWDKGIYSELGIAIKVAQAQAEITAPIFLKAGIREVVDAFYDDMCNVAVRFPTAEEYTALINKWQAKLKEWGIG